MIMKKKKNDRNKFILISAWKYLLEQLSSFTTIFQFFFFFALERKSRRHPLTNRQEDGTSG